MFKQSQKDILIPLKDSKFNILGTYIKTCPEPQYEFSQNKLSVKDEWLIQVVYTKDRNLNAQKEPSLTEFKTSWQEEFPWAGEKPSALTIRYHKKPRSINCFVRNEPPNTPHLHLTIETYLEIDFTESPLQIPVQEKLEELQGTGKIAEKTEEIIKPNPEEKKQGPAKHPIEKEVTEQQVIALTEIMKKGIEEKLANLTALLGNLEKRIEAIEKEFLLNATEKSRLNGVIVDAFRLVPIPRAIMEIYSPGCEEPFIKTFSNSRGYYCVDLSSGLYDIKIKHTHFSTLLIKDYTVKEGEEKLQDFMLHRI